jgi:hypothetical protein
MNLTQNLQQFLSLCGNIFHEILFDRQNPQTFSENELCPEHKEIIENPIQEYLRNNHCEPIKFDRQ